MSLSSRLTLQDISETAERLPGFPAHLAAALSKDVDQMRAIAANGELSVHEALAALANPRGRFEQARQLLMWALYHHQGGASPVGQPIRTFLGIEPHRMLTAAEIERCYQAAYSPQPDKPADETPPPDVAILRYQYLRLLDAVAKLAAKIPPRALETFGATAELEALTTMASVDLADIREARR